MMTVFSRIFSLNTFHNIGIFGTVLSNLVLLYILYFSQFPLSFPINYVDSPEELYKNLRIFIILTIFISIFCFTFFYLQSEDEEQGAKENKYNQEKLEDLIKEILGRERINGFTEDEKRQIINEVIKKTGRDTIEQIFSQETSRLENSFKQKLYLNKLKVSLKQMVYRLSKEIVNLKKRANVNLAIGVVIAIFGVFFLLDTINTITMRTDFKKYERVLLYEEGHSDNKLEQSDNQFIHDLIYLFLPRAVLFVFVQMFSYFFLRLYKEGLSEIKFFQNELTNIQSKFISLETALVANESESIRIAVEAFSKMERNFILNKGQTTIELEKQKSESELAKRILKMTSEAFSKTNK